METKKKFSGSKALVTGAARGIGKVIARTLAQEGASVAVADINSEGAKQLVFEIEKMGGMALAIRVDVTRPQEVSRMVRDILGQWGTLDILVNNAGGFDRINSITKISEDEWDQTIALNLKSTFLCSQAVAEHMMERKKGTIINIASQASLGPSASSAPCCTYGAAKAGVVGFTKHLAKELGPYGITVNAISPGTIATERVVKLRGREGLEKIAEAYPLRHLVEPHDVAEAVLFLASEGGKSITGINLNINCGDLMI
jgi:3-oxoacyl-[acyl-carrier protein] reductase